MTQSPTLSRRPSSSAPSKPAAPRKPRQPKSKRRGADARAGYTFLLPWLLGFIALTVGPMISSLYLSFTNYNLFDAPKWIGLDNYTTMFQDERFLQSVGVTLGYVVFGTPLKLAAALAVAMLLNSKRQRPGLLPFSVLRSVPDRRVASPSPSSGKRCSAIPVPVDQGLSFFGINLGGWVGNPSMTMAMMILLTVWQFGAPMVIFLAGLKQIPGELYEAASMDGAGPVRKFFNITWPMLSPVIFFNLLMETIHAFQIFSLGLHHLQR